MDRGDRREVFPTYTCPHTALRPPHPKSGTSYLHHQLSNTTAVNPFRVTTLPSPAQRSSFTVLPGNWRRWPQRAWFSQSSNVNMYVASYLEA